MKKYLVLFVLFALVLSSCSGSGASIPASGVQTWVDQPIPGTILPLGSFPLKAHARHVDGSGITRIEFLVNGVSVGAVDTDASAPIVYGEINWNASTPGQYTIIARGYAGSTSSDSAPVLVCVSQDVQQAAVGAIGQCSAPASNPTEELPPDKQTEVAPLTTTATFTAIAPPTSTFTAIPSITAAPPTFTSAPPTAVPPTLPPADTQGPDIKSLFHTPNPSTYGACGGSFTMQASTTDVSGISYVVFGYRYEGFSSGGDTTVSGNFIGNATYEATIDHNSGNQAYNILQGGNGYIRWYVQVVDNAGNSTWITDQVAEVQFCPG